MRLLFVHDGPVFLGADGSFYEYSYHGLLDRYRRIADEVTFIMRVEDLPSGASMTKIPDEVRVIPVPNFKSPTRHFKEIGEAKRLIKQTVSEADILVAGGSSCATIAWKYARKMGVPTIYECVGCCWDNLWNYSVLGKIIPPYSFIKTRRIIRKSKYVDYVSSVLCREDTPRTESRLAALMSS